MRSRLPVAIVLLVLALLGVLVLSPDAVSAHHTIILAESDIPNIWVVVPAAVLTDLVKLNSISDELVLRLLEKYPMCESMLAWTDNTPGTTVSTIHVGCAKFRRTET